jgi:hypothetical protein
MEVDPDAPVATTGNAVLDGMGVAASAAVAAVTGNEEPAGDEQWTRIELFVIASLQLVLVLVAYRLDRQAHPALISESAWAVFFGVLVRVLGMLTEVIEPTTDCCGMASCWCGSLALRYASSRPWCVELTRRACSLLQCWCHGSNRCRLVSRPRTGIAQQRTQPGSALLRVSFFFHAMQEVLRHDLTVLVPYS